VVVTGLDAPETATPGGSNNRGLETALIETRLAAIGANRVRVPTSGVAGFETLEALIEHGSAAIGANRIRVPTSGVAGFETLKAPTRLLTPRARTST